VTRRAALLALVPALACASAGPAAPDAAGCEAAGSGPGARCVVAGPAYAAGPVHRLLFGSGYRNLWTTPIAVPVLDLARTAGGLEAVEQLGHAQSTTLALRGADGRAYSFRSTDKDASSQAPAIAARLPGVSSAYRDQTASGHPGAPLVASRLARAAGVLEPERRLVVVPDDARLGPFRETFAGRLGTFEEYPTPAADGRPGTFGALEIVSTDELLERLRSDPAERVDARAYLRARLVDLVLGDVDRHPGQWRFARLAPRAAWQPVPEDRDLALARFDGLLLRLSRPWFPLLGSFDEGYDIVSLAHQAAVTDPWFLAPLDGRAWRAEAEAVQRALAPAVVGRAVEALPAAWRRADGGRLAGVLRRRVEALPAAADALYRRLASEVEVHATARPETVRARALGGGRTELRVNAAGQREPRFLRVFEREETERVRLCGFQPPDVVLVEALDGVDVRFEASCEAARPIVASPRASDEALRSPGSGL
jgi:hypothetical protein